MAQFLIVGVEVVEFLWQDVGVWNEVVLLSPESFLHFHIVVAKSVFASDFIALREVINSLEFVQTFIKVAFARARCP